MTETSLLKPRGKSTDDLWTFDPAAAVVALVLALFFLGGMFFLALRQLAMGGGR